MKMYQPSAAKKVTMPTGRSRYAMTYSNRVMGRKVKMVGGPGKTGT